MSWIAGRGGAGPDVGPKHGAQTPPNASRDWTFDQLAFQKDGITYGVTLPYSMGCFWDIGESSGFLLGLSMSQYFSM